MTWLIADIHGCCETLRRLIDRITRADDNAKFVFVGDYCDRGYKSQDVIDVILDLQNDVLACLRGNHDDIIDWFLNDHAVTDVNSISHDAPLQGVVSWWMFNGFGPTLDSYGVSGRDIISEFRQKVPQSHKEFYRNLTLIWENETHFAVHGWADPLINNPLDNINAYSALWNRFEKDEQTGTMKYINPSWEKIGVFGHTPVVYYGATQPLSIERIRLIDCYACGNLYLAGYCCELDNWILQSTVEEDGRGLNDT